MEHPVQAAEKALHAHAPPAAERFSFWTHAVSALAAIPVLVMLILQAEGALAITSVAVYGATLILLFSSSAFHHVVGTMGPKWHAISRRMDHIAIFLLIAGTYTPVSLLTLGGAWGWSIFGVIWGLGLGGVILKIVTPHSPRWITVGLYLGMGWIAVVAIWPLLQNMLFAGLMWMAAGGAAYTVGAVMYARKKPDPWPMHVGFHGIWHVFVMIGAGCHVVMTWLYVV